MYEYDVSREFLELLYGRTKTTPSIFAMKDIRDEIFRGIMDRVVTAVITAAESGVIAGTEEAAEKAKCLGLTLTGIIEEGKIVRQGDQVARMLGTPKQIALAEDLLIGLIAKTSGIATATGECVKRAGKQIEIVCGAWKKMPVVLKDSIRKAVMTGGGHFRISKEPFIYLDKNYIRMLGGIRDSLHAVDRFKDYKKVVQIKGDQVDIAIEAYDAADCKADIIFIDSGKAEDILIVDNVLTRNALRSKVKIAFGGNVKIEDIDGLRRMPLDILEIGRNIIDAPLLDLRLDVVQIG